VRKAAYVLRDSLAALIAEKSSLTDYGVEPERSALTNDEIAAIRAALKKLTAIRILNTNDAEDLIQETLLTMISKQPGKVLEKGPLVWGLGILRKKVGNYYRKIQRYEPLGVEELLGQKLRITTTPEAGIFHDELKMIVEEVLSQFPDSQRRAVELMIAGCDAGEIAKALHPERYQNVINRLYRGRKKLVEALAKYGYRPRAAAGLGKMKRCRGKNPKPSAGETQGNCSPALETDPVQRE
jgi:RNA polymerase sigma factor (sigma-70 family)